MIAARLLSFCEALRKNGVRAAEQEVLDAFRAVDVLGADAFVQRERLRDVLSCTLAKSAAEEETLARVFDLHFDLVGGDASPLADLLRARGLDDAAIAQALAEAGDDDLTRALIEGDASRVGELVRAAVDDSDLDGLQSSLQIAYFTARVLGRLGIVGAGGGALGFELSERLRRAVRRAVEQELDKRSVQKPRRTGALLDRDLRALDNADAEELRRLVRKLALRLRERLAVRRKRSRRGRIDARKMLRRSVATDAIPMKIAIVRKKPQKPEVIILCDVSDSVRQASLFMLELTTAVSDVLRRVRSFVFVDRVGEVTDLMKSGDDATRAILAGDVIPVGANSDYGRALRDFWDRCGNALTKKTTLVILGDGRSNYRSPEDWILGECRRRARRLLWLCPEDRPTWGFGDSEMTRYARHADAIFVVRSAADLARAVERL